MLNINNKLLNKKLLIFLSLFSLSFISFGQVDFRANKIKESWFISADYGVQISGIKKEDFVNSNISPLYGLSIGKWFNDKLAIKFGYQGIYFNYIGDNKKHYYNFYYTEALIDLKELFLSKSSFSRQKFILHAGPGLFYNFEEDRHDINSIFGYTSEIFLTNQLMFRLDISAIIGWDIYQENLDILPSLASGITYQF